MILASNLGDELFRATLEELMSGRLSIAPLLEEVVPEVERTDGIT